MAARGPSRTACSSDEEKETKRTIRVKSFTYFPTCLAARSHGQSQQKPPLHEHGSTVCVIAHMVPYCFTWFLFHDMLFEVMNRHSAAHTQYRNTSLLTRTNRTTHAAACNCENKGNGILRARHQRSSFSCALRRQSHGRTRQKPRLLCYAHPGAPRNPRKQLDMTFIISQMQALI